MLKKKHLKSRPVCKVTFELPKTIAASSANVVGDFNGWDGAATPMKRLKDGRFTVTVELDAGCEYQFRYLIDGVEWHNDWDADRYVPNSFGSENSVVLT